MPDTRTKLACRTEFKNALESIGAARARLDYVLASGAAGQSDSPEGFDVAGDLERAKELIQQAIEQYKS